MTEIRTKELLTMALRHIPSQANDPKSLYKTLHESIGMTNGEIMECGMEHLRGQFEYEWAPGMLELAYAERLDRILPQHDVYTTSRWIEYLSELAGDMESSFEKEAEDALLAFQEITKRFPPQVVAQVYETIHAQDNALLPNEVVMAAEQAQLGATAQELSDMAANGAFEGGTVPRHESTPDGGMMGGIQDGLC